jgi:hypothetical protein
MDFLRYYLATVVVAIAVVGLALGDGWVWLGIATFPVLLALDIFLKKDLRKRNISNNLLADVPLYLHLPLMVTLWALFIVRLGEWSNGDVSDPVTGLMVLGMALSVGWLGAVPTVPVTHELMHRRHWFPVAVSKVMGTVYLDPNRDVGHKLTHHLFLCTPADSDTPHRGQTIYAFMWQASYGAYKDAVVSSLNSLRKRDLSIFHWKNSLYVEFGLLASLMAVIYLAAGASGLAVAFATMFFSKLLLEGLNFLQHYGLVRVPGTPIRYYHAWNHLGRIIRPLGMEITNHMNHHFDSKYKFHELEPRPDGAQMPSALLCFVCALVPPVWSSYIAKPLLKDWDTRFATPEEQLLAMQANRRAGWPEWVHPQVPSTSARAELKV